ncbi:hypothetical protein GIB67_006618 [Kingdonia uniflora]|uniref:Histone deacetylase interacting domain-containing protein n=1 Tax=Kingdonia uniflora TaxID=39325 RepID=A0A7J7LEJ6_9MAGN|nr:hypothetical protein GIB67_006618 [Kingdonia uniflora]
MSLSEDSKSYGQHQVQGVGKHILTGKDVLAHLKAIKGMFMNQDRDKDYVEFLRVMKDFRAQRLQTTEFVARVKDLFQGHWDVVIAFNMFLPKRFEITLPLHTDEPQRIVPLQFEKFTNFVEKIKARFQDDFVYNLFLGILDTYRKGNKSVIDVYEEVAILFKDHPDLLQELLHFLPDYELPALVQHTQSRRTSSLQHRDQNNFALPSSQRIQTEKRKRNIIYHAEPDHKMQCLPKKHKPSSRVQECGSKKLDQGACKRGFIFCEKMKEALHNLDDYQQFLNHLKSYSLEEMTRSELLSWVSSLLENYLDLKDEFHDFLNQCGKMDERLGALSKKSLWSERNGDKERVCETDEMGKDEDCKSERVDRDESQPLQNVSVSSKNKYIDKSISQLNLSKCESCSPTYRLLPKNYPTPCTSGRTEVGAQVLNDCWVSVTSGTEDYSSRDLRKKPYEEIMFRCDEHMYELDMLLESVKSTTTRVEELLEKIHDNSIGSDDTICIEDHLSAMNLRCIERLYSNHGLDVVDRLRKKTSTSLPIICVRLKEKHREWSRCRTAFNPVWAKVYADNPDRPKPPPTSVKKDSEKTQAIVTSEEALLTSEKDQRDCEC